MNTENIVNKDLWFLSGGGEMGQLIRDKDWSKTSLGAPESWPRSLRTMVAVMLDNPFGMYIAWGNDYTQLYNDGYRPILGATKHPQALGISTRETFSEIWHIIESMFDGVMKGTAVGFPDLMLPLNRNGFVEECYFDFAYSPIRKDDGEVGGVLVTVIETTNKKKAEEALKESEARFRAIADEAPVFIFLAGENAEVEYLNKTWREYTGISTNDSKGRAWAEITHIDDIDPATKIYMDGFNKRESCSFENRQKGIDGIYRTILWKATPRFSPNGQFIGMMGVGLDIHERKKSEEKLRKSERLYEAVTKNTPDLIYVFDLNYRFTYANEALLNMWGRKWHDAIGKGMLELGYEPWHAEMHEREIDQVIKTKKTIRGEVSFPHATLGKRIYDYIFAPLVDGEGNVVAITGTTRDVTQLVEARKQIEESDKRFRTTVKQAPVGITILRGPKYVVEMANDAYLQLVDRTEDEFIGQPLFDSLPEVEESVHSLLDRVLNTGVPYHGNEVEIPVNRYGKQEIVYFDFLYYPLKEEDGQVSGVIVTVTEVSEKVEARKKTEQNEERLNIVVEASELGTYELNLKTKEPKYSKRYLEIIGGYKEDITLTHEQLLQHLHPDDMRIRERAFKDALNNGYLHFEARLIWKDKSIHWMEGKGKVFYDKENNPVKLIGTIRDITDVKNHEQELDKLVKERTIQLERSNEDLQQFAHVASHDLKEPLRKIKIFTNRMKEEHGDSLPAPAVNFLEKIMGASSRMQMMVDGVLSFSSVNSTEQPIQKIDLNRTFKNLKNDLEIVIEQKKAKIIADNLPIIEGGDILINQLFYNLLQNALKFSKENEAPVIEISSSIINEDGNDRAKILIKDNGIGFDQNNAEKIFETFVRLNSKDIFEGTGLGLSLCKKIAERHHGSIEARSREMEGTTFIITLPIKQMKSHI